jgi:hypothetical protein
VVACTKLRFRLSYEFEEGQATARMPWKIVRAGCTYSAALSGFNGATARTPWKITPRRLQASRAEMLQWGHGANAVEDKGVFD